MGSQIVKVALQADVGSFVSGFAHADTVAGKLGSTLGLLTRTGSAVGGVIQDLGRHAQNFAKAAAGAGASGMLFFGGLGYAAAQLEAPLRNVQTLMGSEFGA